MSDVLAKRCDWCGERSAPSEHDPGERSRPEVPAGWGSMSLTDTREMRWFDLCPDCIDAVRLTRTYRKPDEVSGHAPRSAPIRRTFTIDVSESIGTGLDRLLRLAPPAGERLRVAGFTFGWSESRYVYMTSCRVGTTSILRAGGAPVALAELHSEGFPETPPTGLVDHEGAVDAPLEFVISNLRDDLPPSVVLVHLLGQSLRLEA